jgi:hypothetical protein
MRILEPDATDPGPVPLRPAPPVAVAVAVPQKKLTEAVPSPQQIPLGIFPGSQQVAQRFLFGVRYGHERQFARPVEPSQLVRVAAVRLHSFPRPARYQGRRSHLADQAPARQQPLRLIPARPCLVHAPYPRSVRLQPPDSPSPTPIVRHQLEPLDRLPSLRRKDRNLHRVGVNVHPYPNRRILHDRFLPYVALQRKLQPTLSTRWNRSLHSD